MIVLQPTNNSPSKLNYNDNFKLNSLYVYINKPHLSKVSINEF